MPVTIPIFEGKYKVTKRGERGKVVTIPQSYTKAQGLEPGSEINVYVQGDCLILQPIKKEKSNAL